MTFAVSWGEYGGFYLFNQHRVRRLCIGWVAFTVLPYELDDLMEMAAKERDPHD